VDEGLALVTEGTQLEAVRDITDVGIRLTATVPAAWSEIDVEGAVLVVGGRLEDNDQTLVPSVQVRVQPADDAGSAAAAVTGVRDLLREAVVLFERSGEGPAGFPETVAEIAHRSDVTNATQISMFRTIYLPDPRSAISIVATCGGGASEAARDALRGVVTSVSVSPIPESAPLE
jgi:hypothetical protein